MTEEAKLNFEFTVAETNVILSFLGNGAYTQVAGLIDIIKNQAAAQIQANPELAAAAEAASQPPAEDEATEEAA